MHVRQIGFDEKSFARKAIKIMVDTDTAELNKPNLDVDIKININLSAFFREIDRMGNLLVHPNIDHKKYLSWCKKNVEELQVVEKRHFKSAKGTINPYHFVSTLFNIIPRNTDIVTGDGTAAVVTFKAAKLKSGQRLFTNKGCASMGYDLPAILGALYASNNDKRNKILITGDGSIMMNLQELSSLRPFRKKNIKIPILKNQTPWQEISRKMVGQLETGACLETESLYLDITNTKGMPRHSH